jgi:hypothetical protein
MLFEPNETPVIIVLSPPSLVMSLQAKLFIVSRNSLHGGAENQSTEERILNDIACVWFGKLPLDMQFWKGNEVHSTVTNERGINLRNSVKHKMQIKGHENSFWKIFSQACF